MSPDYPSYQPAANIDGLFDQALDESDSIFSDICPALLDLRSQEQHYTRLTPIGKGAIKEVYRCYDTRAKREVCLVKPRAELGVEFYELFIHEAWLTAHLKHPNIIKIHEVNVSDDGIPFFTMDLKSNRTLAEYSQSAPPLDELLVVFLKVCDALSYAHSQDIIHLDLKPENIQCDSYGEVLVCDWGLGKFASDVSDASESQPFQSISDTLYGEIKGSLGYMSPEQIHHGAHKSFASDIYSLGCLLHFLITGTPVYTGSQQEILEQTQNSTRTSMRLRHPEVPKSLDAVFLKATSLSPSDRYPSVLELKQEIRRYLQGHSTEAEEPTILERGRRFILRHRQKTAISAVSLLVIGVLLTVFLTTSKTLKNQRDQEQHLNSSLNERMQALTEEYQLFESAVMDSRLNLAVKINETIYQSVSYAYETDNPVLTLSQQRMLARKSLELAPELQRTYSIFARLSLISRDFDPIYAIPTDRSNEHVHHYNRLARLYESMQFPDPSAPHPDELSKYIRSLKRLVVNYNQYVLQSNIVANMIHYDCYRADKKHLYISPIMSLLERIAPSLTATYSPTNNSLTLTTKNNTIFPRHDHDILSLLHLDTLSIQAPRLNLSYLHHATISHLELSRVYQIQLPKPIYINGLDTLSVSQDAPSDQLLRQQIKSQQLYTIVRK